MNVTIPFKRSAAFLEPPQPSEIEAVGEGHLGLLASRKLADSRRQRESRNALFNVTSTNTQLCRKAL
jgi:hypothetical protein